MPQVELHGHFAVIASIIEPMRLRAKKDLRCYGWRHIALLQIDPVLKPPSRIDPRIKSIKKIISLSETFGYYTNKGYYAFGHEWRRMNKMAEKFNKLYPMHIMAKEWPLPLPVYVD